MYSYTTPNSELISTLSLQLHPEGGYFAETERLADEVPSPYADGQPRSLATEIYYLLAPSSPRGRMHMNKSATFHVLHSGRSLYTLMRPSSVAGGPPEIEHAIMGEDHSKGEVRQLFVPGGWWKASEIPAEDLKSGEKERVGALITEVVVPGFHWEDHAFLNKEELLKIYGGDENAEGYKKLESYTQAISN
ncbi:uncharacterized protein P7C70_g2678, partial [Phenoliferia sp. Uapishka_3]